MFSWFTSSAGSSNPSSFQKKVSAVPEFVQGAIDDSSKVTIFSKSWCPYCTRAKRLFSSQYPNVSVTVKEIDDLDEGDAIQDYLLEKTGARSVPSIWINKKYVGGCDDVMSLNAKGKLAGLLAA